MSASTATIPISTPNNNHQLTLDSNPTHDTRKRVIAITKRKPSPDINGTGTGTGIGTPVNDKALILSGRDLSHTIRGETLLDKPNKDSNPNPSLRKKKIAKTSRSNLQIVANLLVKLCAFAMFVSWLVSLYNWYEGKPFLGTGTPEERLSQVENSLKKTTKMLQVQVDIIDQKIGSEIEKTRLDLSSKFDEKTSFLQSEIQKLEGHNDKIAELFLSKQEFQDFMSEFKSQNPESENRESISQVSLDEIRLFAKQMVEREITKHSADGIGMPDFALYSGGARVVRHSEAFYKEKGGFLSGKKVNEDAKKMLEPSFGEPGQCFALKGTNGFVEVKLRKVMVPQAFTIEHVDKSVAYDRSSAPKTVQITGWYKGEAPEDEISEQRAFVLADIIYDLNKPNIQTFTVDPVNSDDESKFVVNTVRFEVLDNYGNDDVTCIYRFRVHGYEPGSPSMMALEG